MTRVLPPRPRTLALAGVVAALVALPATASASYPAGSVGHDVSYPQCTSSGSSTTKVGSLGGAFGIVGVTGGRPWSANSCAVAEASWAAGRSNPPGLYMNTANPAPTSSYYWPASGAHDPALCADASSTTDPGCAYDYGWHAAADALLTEAKNIPNAASMSWWLDVETANSWNGNGSSNAADLQGAIDYLRSYGVPSVGIYSTSSQWSTISGGYSSATVSAYSGAWSAEFTPAYPMTDAPLWIAGLGNASSASTACATTFTGGPTWLAQYDDGSGYDADLACGAAPAASFTVAVSPSNATVKRGGKASSTVTVTETGPTQTVGLAASNVPQGVTVSFTPSSLASSGTSTMKVAVARSAAPGTYDVAVTGSAASGQQSATYTLTVR